jgi:carbon storage regulator
MLTRKLGEQIAIGDDVVITVAEVKGRYVKLGIEAPPDVKVWRMELLDRMRRGNRATG